MEKKMIKWKIESEIDPRWNIEHSHKGMVKNGFLWEMISWISDCNKKYGHQPQDLRKIVVKNK